MLLGGDEIGRTQHGNNNAYCQDNELSWFDWEHVDADLLEFTRDVIALRREHPTFRRRRWFQGRPIRGALDIAWLRPDGTEMDDADWNAESLRSVGVLLDGAAIPGHDARGQPITDDSFFLILNADVDSIDWTMPARDGQEWQIVVDTTSERERGITIDNAKALTVASRSMVVVTAQARR
jgi:glycogen operon protein